MQSFIRRPSRRAAVIAGAAGLAVLGAVGFGAAAFADGTAPSAGTSQAAMPAPSGVPSGAPAAPSGGPAGKHSPHIGGTVQSVDGTSVTVQDPEGFTRTIVLGSDAKVTKGTSSSSTDAITKGTWIEATGTVDSNGTSLDATAVAVGRPTPPAGGPGRAKGGLPTPTVAGAGAGAGAPPASGSAAPAAPSGGTAHSAAPGESTSGSSAAPSGS